MRVDSKVWAAAAVPVLLFGLSAGGCTVSALDKYDPPPHLGRPGWVRVTAGFGGWIGGGVGALASLALLPVTYPVSLLAEEPLGCSQTEFRFMPVSMTAATGHYLLGAPLDALDFLFRRAWLEEDKTPGYEFTPMPAPKLRDRAMESTTQPRTPEDRDRPARTKKDGTDQDSTDQDGTDQDGK